MKKVSVFIMAAAFFIAFYEHQKTNSKVYITVGAIAVFMYGMMRLSAKVPSKNQDKDEDNV